jgi:hypothetical protein
MCGRLTLALHACLHAPGTDVPRATVEKAVALLQWLIAQRERVLHESLATTQTRQEAAAEAVMIQKLRSRGGRLRRRDLFRMYDQQREAIHDPVLQRLMQKGTAFCDKGGFVGLREQFEQDTPNQRIVLRTY